MVADVQVPIWHHDICNHFKGVCANVMLSIQQHQLFIKGFLCYGMPHAIYSCCFRFMFLKCRGYELTDDDRTISTTSIFATYISIYGCLDSYHPVADTNTFPLQIHIFFYQIRVNLLKPLGDMPPNFALEPHIFPENVIPVAIPFQH